ncbi:CD1375 family protein [Levilactobacillus lindianensis]|uniref:CD1375 family protein n=1 Tax=Levilactobacillus lindianensis TaxID=2486018 RepID=UPI0013DDF1C7|nr:CD1375 family protein [Levilactobacillus lindianensis]
MTNFSSLAAIYASFVLDGVRTIDQVPAILTDQVKQILGISTVVKNSSGTDESMPA